MKILKVALTLGAIFFGASAFASNPVISDVTVRQRWPWSKLVDINYKLVCSPGEAVDIVVNGFNGALPLALPSTSLSGDLEGVSSGAHRIVWDPTATTYTHAGVLSEFRVELSVGPPPLYMIVDLTKAKGADGQIEYVYESELRAGTWGSWVENPVTNLGSVIESVVWTGVTNDMYMTTKLVLRRVPAGSYTMGEGSTYEYAMTLTQAYYAGVFTVTEAQWGEIMGSGTTSKPKVSVSYDDIRGATTDNPSVNWPHTDRTLVSPGSFLGQLRSKTGISDFDLPTETQWEYLCRAMTTTYYHDGLEPIITNRVAQMDLLGWYNITGGARPVGQKAANAWGIYDTHGNVSEWCLDWSGNPVSGDDPPGPGSSTTGRNRRGGAYNSSAINCKPTIRQRNIPSTQTGAIGFRLVRTLP